MDEAKPLHEHRHFRKAPPFWLELLHIASIVPRSLPLLADEALLSQEIASHLQQQLEILQLSPIRCVEGLRLTMRTVGLQALTSGERFHQTKRALERFPQMRTLSLFVHSARELEELVVFLEHFPEIDGLHLQGSPRTPGELDRICRALGDRPLRTLCLGFELGEGSWQTLHARLNLERLERLGWCPRNAEELSLLRDAPLRETLRWCHFMYAHDASNQSLWDTVTLDLPRLEHLVVSSQTNHAFLEMLLRSPLPLLTSLQVLGHHLERPGPTNELRQRSMVSLERLMSSPGARRLEHLSLATLDMEELERIAPHLEHLPACCIHSSVSGEQSMPTAWKHLPRLPPLTASVLSMRTSS